ncbi:MAG: hypothetical protein AABX70_02910 [Nanoarchaeota archaeon]
MKSIPKQGELKRKLLHVGWIVLALFSWWALPLYGIGVVMLILVELLGVLLLFDFLRVEWKWPLLQGIMRDKEDLMFCGATTGMLGVIVCFALLDPGIACLATLCMGVGDLVAGIVRMKWGKHLFLKKTWEDFVAGAIASSAACLLLVPSPFLIIPMTLAAQLAENAVSVLDDNLVMVLTAGLMGQLMLVLI